MKHSIKTALTAITGAALLAAAPASAQGDDLDPVAVAAASRYALPLAFDGFMRRCATGLDASGYANTNATRLRAKFAQGADAAWPAAKVAMMQIANEKAGDMSAMFEMMGDDALRPMVDGLIEGMVSQELKTENCGDIERGLEILDPLPAENLAQMVGFMVEVAQREKAGNSGNAR